MPNRLSTLLTVLALAAPAAALEPGATVPAFEATDSDGTQRTLASQRGKLVVLVVWSSSCPQSKSYGPKLTKLAGQFAGKAVFWGVAPNKTETADKVNRGKAAAKVSFPVLLDAGGKVAKSLGAVTTPTVYVIDGQGKLRYVGGIDDDPRDKKERAQHWLRDAVTALLAGESPPKPKTRPGGFRIKY